MQLNHKQFPVYEVRCPTKTVQFVKWDLLHEDQAEINHKQSLEVLASRGGMTWTELYWNYYKLPLNTHQDAHMMRKMMEALIC